MQSNSFKIILDTLGNEYKKNLINLLNKSVKKS